MALSLNHTISALLEEVELYMQDVDVNAINEDDNLREKFNARFKRYLINKLFTY